MNIIAVRVMNYTQRREFSSNPGVLSRVFNTLDANTTAYQVITHD